MQSVERKLTIEMIIICRPSYDQLSLSSIRFSICIQHRDEIAYVYVLLLQMLPLALVVRAVTS